LVVYGKANPIAGAGSQVHGRRTVKERLSGLAQRAVVAAMLWSSSVRAHDDVEAELRLHDFAQLARMELERRVAEGGHDVLGLDGAERARARFGAPALRAEAAVSPRP
jgi:hypothetical protein